MLMLILRKTAVVVGVAVDAEVTMKVTVMWMMMVGETGHAVVEAFWLGQTVKASKTKMLMVVVVAASLEVRWRMEVFLGAEVVVEIQSKKAEEALLMAADCSRC